MLRPKDESACTEKIIEASPNKTLLGLSNNLWRLAIVTGIAQFSMGVWAWYFTIFLEGIVQPWQIGLIVSTGLLFGILGFPISGFISDIIGRRKTMISSFVPMSIGLLALYLFPVWPFIPLFYGIVQFGWSFVLIISRAIPADEIAAENGRHSARRFTMVLFPTFIAEGIAPMFASIMLTLQIPARMLLLYGAIGASVAFIVAAILLRETLSVDLQQKARKGKAVPLRELGGTFWKTVVGMLGFTFSFYLSFFYLGNLAIREWQIPEAIYGYSWSIFSFTAVIFMYTLSSVADKWRRSSLLIAVIANSLILSVLALGEGVLLLILLNAIWAIPVMLWIGAERSLVVCGVQKEHQGRALGTYQVIMSSTGVIAANIGAWIWTVTDNLRTLFSISSILMLFFAFVLALVLTRIDLGMSIENEL